MQEMYPIFLTALLCKWLAPLKLTLHVVKQ